MKVSFFHDGPLVKDSADNYYGVSINDKLKQRYLKFGSSVKFVIRVRSADENENIKGRSVISNDRFEVTQIPNFKTGSSYFRNKSKAEQIINSEVEKTDIVISRLPSAIGAIAFKHAINIGKPVLVEFVACVFDALWNYDWRGKLLAKYKLRQYQEMIKHASHVIYVTDQFLQKRYPTLGKSIGCSDVMLNSLDETKLAQRLDQIKKEGSNSMRQLSTVAAIDVVYKGQADVIQALYKLKQQSIYFNYKIIGQGNPTRLQKFIDELELNDLIKIVGPLPHGEVFNQLEKTDIYIQPSKQEGLPRAVIEAMSLGCPVIGSDTGGIPELIQPECVYPKGNISQLIQKLTTVNKDFLLKQAKANFEKSKQYESSYLEKKRTDFYNEFLNDHGLKKISDE